MASKTLRDYIEDQSLKDEDLIIDKDGKERWFISDYYKTAISVHEKIGHLRQMLSKEKEEQVVLTGLRGYHKYLGGIVGCSRLHLHLSDVEATEDYHEAAKNRAEQHWDSLPEDKKMELVQFAYDNGEEVGKEDIDKYKIKTI